MIDNLYCTPVLTVLNRLTDEAMRSARWQWRRPVPPTNLGQEEPEDVVDEDEIILERLEEEMAEDYSDEDEADILHIDEVIMSMTMMIEDVIIMT